ncbi:SAM-dependent methyltransferase [uncultured Sphingomonas sp.]|uniref:SAM-dependent methyltransferase n=1 Tax=uncultured Sphingomonas sp. TaxID=158754 RepID=UPI0035C94FAF
MKAPAQQPGYFDRLYAANPDPWGFEGNPYEDAKYAATVAALPRPHYRSALEVGCSIGMLTARIAPACDALLATDVADAALACAAERCASLPQVRFMRSALPETAPNGRFDLILLSEVLYYFDRPALALVARALSAVAEPGADIVLVHWLGPTPDYPLNGDEAVEAFEENLPAATVIGRDRQEGYRLDVLRTAPAG